MMRSHDALTAGRRTGGRRALRFGLALVAQLLSANAPAAMLLVLRKTRRSIDPPRSAEAFALLFCSFHVREGERPFVRQLGDALVHRTITVRRERLDPNEDRPAAGLRCLQGRHELERVARHHTVIMI